MSKAELERQHLSQADRHIADAERLVTEQEQRLAERRRRGHDTAEGERLLRNMRECLEQYHVHRRMIVDALSEAEAEGGRATEG